MESFNKRISLALGLIKEESDSPKKPELPGKKEKSAAGAHRFDDGVEYNQMESDTTFQHKADERTLK